MSSKKSILDSHTREFVNPNLRKKSEKKNVVFDIKDLNVWYQHGHKHAIKGISMNITEREVTAFIGPSGCGKSTVLRCLNRMNDLIEGIKIRGSIIFDDEAELISIQKKSLKNLWGLLGVKKEKNSKDLPIVSPLELRTRVGMVFQKPNPFPMSIYDNVAYGPKSSGVKDKKELNKIVKTALKDSALWDEVKDRLHDPAEGLSGGQQQRLCIARAIAMEPEVLLMDEPTSALDPIAAAKIEELIKKLKKKYTTIIVTHSMQQASRISDKTAFFYLGELVEFSSTRKLFTNPKEKLTAKYITGRMG